MEHPEDYRDTNPRAMEVWLELQRSMPRGEKLRQVLESSQLLLQMYEMGVRLQYPDADDGEVRRRVAARHLPRELVLRAYGWDPGPDGNGL